MNGDHLFNRPTDEWTDGQIRAGLVVLAREIEQCKAAGDTGKAEVWTAFAIVLAQERDRRAQVGRAVDAAMVGGPLFADLPGTVGEDG